MFAISREVVLIALGMYNWRKHELRDEPNAPLNIGYLDTIMAYFKGCEEKWYNIGLKLGVKSDSSQNLHKANYSKEECLEI